MCSSDLAQQDVDANLPAKDDTLGRDVDLTPGFRPARDGEGWHGMVVGVGVWRALVLEGQSA